MSSVYRFYLLRSNFSHFFIGWLAISHPHLFLFHAMYTYWIPFIGGVFFSRCTVFQHSLSLIALLHLYHFYLLRRIFVGLILLPQEITTMPLLDLPTFALSRPLIPIWESSLP